MTDFRFGVIAVVPFWSQSRNMNADSNFGYLRAVIPEMERQTTDTVFLIFFPDPEYGHGRWVYHDDGLQSDRVMFIRWPYDTTMRSSVLGFDPERFARIDLDFGPVTYWANQVETAGLIAGGYRQSFNTSARPSLVAQHHYIIHPSLPYRTDGLFPRLWAQIGGSLAADRVVYNSNHCRVMARESFLEWLSFRKFAELDSKSSTLLFGLVDPNQPVAPVAEPGSKPIVLYNHRFEAYKRPDVTFDVLDSLRGEFDFEIWATQTVEQKSGGRRQYQYDRTIFEPARADYLARIAFPAINTINSVHETYCIAIMDSIAAGHLVVVPNGVTFPELLPRDYPFKFNDPKQQRSMIRHIFQTWPVEYNRWREPLSEWAKTEFGVEQYVARYLDLIAETESAYRNHKPKPSTIRTMNRIWDNMKPGVGINPREFRKQIPKAGTRQAGDQAYSTRRIIRDSLIFRDDIGVRLESGAVRIFRRE